MVIGKDPPKEKDEGKTAGKVRLEDLPDPARAKKKAELKKKGGYRAQAMAVSAHEQVPGKKGAAAATKKADSIGELKKLFRDMDLPEQLAPNNVEGVDFDPKNGNLTIRLKNSFSKQFDQENTITFEKTISANLTRGSMAGISGIRRGSATIVSITRKAPGVVAILGKLGPFSKTLEFRDEQLPTLP